MRSDGSAAEIRVDRFSIIFLCINVTKNQTQQNEILAIKLDFAADNTSMACRPLELGN